MLPEPELIPPVASADQERASFKESELLAVADLKPNLHYVMENGHAVPIPGPAPGQSDKAMQTWWGRVHAATARQMAHHAPLGVPIARGEHLPQENQEEAHQEEETTRENERQMTEAEAALAGTTENKKAGEKGTDALLARWLGDAVLPGMRPQKRGGKDQPVAYVVIDGQHVGLIDAPVDHAHVYQAGSRFGLSAEARGLLHNALSEGHLRSDRDLYHTIAIGRAIQTVDDKKDAPALTEALQHKTVEALHYLAAHGEKAQKTRAQALLKALGVAPSQEEAKPKSDDMAAWDAEPGLMESKHWVTIHGHRVLVGNHPLGLPQVHQAAHRFGLSQPAASWLVGHHAGGGLPTDKHLTHTLAIAHAMQRVANDRHAAASGTRRSRLSDSPDVPTLQRAAHYGDIAGLLHAANNGDAHARDVVRQMAEDNALPAPKRPVIGGMRRLPPDTPADTIMVDGKLVPIFNEYVTQDYLVDLAHTFRLGATGTAYLSKSLHAHTLVSSRNLVHTVAISKAIQRLHTGKSEEAALREASQYQTIEGLHEAASRGTTQGKAQARSILNEMEREGVHYNGTPSWAHGGTHPGGTPFLVYEEGSVALIGVRHPNGGYSFQFHHPGSDAHTVARAQTVLHAVLTNGEIPEDAPVSVPAPLVGRA